MVSERLNEAAHTRTSWLRQKTEGLRTGLVEKIYEVAPWLEADDLTMLGLAGVALGAYAAKKANEVDSDILRGGSLLLTLLSAGIDGLDGEWARKFGVPSLRGKLLDVGSDRLQELLLALSRASTAHKKGDVLGEHASYVTAVTSIWPSYFRGEAERQEIKVSEDGYGILGKIGTHPGRMITGAVAASFGQVKVFDNALVKRIPGIDKLTTFLPFAKELSVQAVIDSVSVTSNLVTTFDRMFLLHAEQMYNEEEIKNLPEEEQEGLAKKRSVAIKEAEIKKRLLIFLAGVSIGAVSYTHTKLRRPQKH